MSTITPLTAPTAPVALGKKCAPMAVYTTRPARLPTAVQAQPRRRCSSRTVAATSRSLSPAPEGPVPNDMAAILGIWALCGDLYAPAAGRRHEGEPGWRATVGEATVME